MASEEYITKLLSGWRDGEEGAEDALVPLIYDELHRQAQLLMRRERPGHTIQPTALVHEAYLKLRGADVDWHDRGHFYALCARTMRRLLVNHATARSALKRGGGDIRVTLTGNLEAESETDADLLDLVDALEALAELDPEKAQLVELRYFGGLTIAEMETHCGLSSATIGRHLRFARAWMHDRMTGASE